MARILLAAGKHRCEQAAGLALSARCWPGSADRFVVVVGGSGRGARGGVANVNTPGNNSNSVFSGGWGGDQSGG